MSRRRGCGESDIEQPGAPVSSRPLCVFVPLWCNARRGPLRPTLVSVPRGRPSVLLQELPDCRGGDAGGEARAVGHTRDLLLRVIDDADGVRGLSIDYPRELAGAAQGEMRDNSLFRASVKTELNPTSIGSRILPVLASVKHRREVFEWSSGLAVECGTRGSKEGREKGDEQANGRGQRYGALNRTGRRFGLGSCPIAGQIACPIAGQIACPVVGQVACPMTGRVACQVAGRIAWPIAGRIAWPIAGQIACQVAGRIAWPIAGQIAYPRVGGKG